MTSTWPVVLSTQDLRLQALRFRDRTRWNDVRSENREWLSPWEATIPILPGGSPQDPTQLPSYFQMVRTLNSEARQGRSFSFAIWHQRNLVGQISLGGLSYGAMRGGHIGYWIDKNYANRGFTTQAVTAVTEFSFTSLDLHRIEINVRPENAASRRVAEKAGYIFEGERPRYLHIGGTWRDHVVFVKENPAVK